MKNTLSRKRGFTLIELMIVIAIIGILAAILVPNYVKSRAQGLATACKSNLKNIGTALEMYAHDATGRFPTTSNGIRSLTPNYLKIVPTCPSVGGSAPYLSGYSSSQNPDAYTMVCSGLNHAQATYGTNFPQYTSVQGLVER